MSAAAADAAWYSYGAGEAARIRELIHAHVIAQRLISDALPTTVRSVYYVGSQAGWWLSDADFVAALMAGYDARGEKRSSRPRLMSQWISDHVQWLIDRGYISEDEVVDESAQTFDFLGTTDLVDSVTTRARLLVIDPWSPNPVPYLLAEGNNDMTFVAPLGRRNRCRWAPLGGMASRGMLRKVAAEIDPDAPIGYVGDFNKAGSDIEAAAERFLQERGWDGEWTRIAITEDQAEGLPRKTKIDRRFKVPVAEESVESAAMPVADIRAAIQDWLDEQLPVVADTNDDDRDDLVEWLELFAQLDDTTADAAQLVDDVQAIIDRRMP